MEKRVVPVRSAGKLPEVKMGRKLMLVLVYSVLDNSTSVVCGTSWSVLDAIVVTAPFSVRKMDDPLME